MRQIEPAFLGWGAVAVGAALRLGLFLVTPTDSMLTPDSSTYLGMADSFPSGYLNGHVWGFARPPGYPLFLAVVPGDVRVDVFVQVLISIATIWFVWRLGDQLLPGTAGTVAAWLIAVEPSSIFHSTLVLSDTVFAALLVVATMAVWNGILALRSGRLGAAAGLVLGLAALTRPLGLYLPIVLGACLALFKRGRTVAVVLVVSASLIIGAWTLRNFLQAGIPSISSLESQNLLYWRAAGAVAAEEERSFWAVKHDLEARIESEDHATLGDQFDAERELAIQLLREHPRGFVSATLPQARMMLFQADLQPFERSSWLSGIFSPLRRSSVTALIFLSVYIAAMVGGVRLWRTDRLTALLLVAPTVYLIGISLGPETYDRFRLPWWPFVSLLASHVLVSSRTEQATG